MRIFMNSWGNDLKTSATVTPKGPYVLVDIADDNPRRGDVRAVQGIARAISAKQGWPVTLLTSQTPYSRPLSLAFLHALKLETRQRPYLEHMRKGWAGELWLHERDHIARIQSHIKDHGAPAITLATPASPFSEKVAFSSSDPEATFRSLYQSAVIARDWAEHLSVNMGSGQRDDALVAHDFDAEYFCAASAEFQARYPELCENGPLIALLYCDYAHPSVMEEKLIRLLDNYDCATLAICGAPRTQSFDQAQEFFREHLPPQIRFHSFPFVAGAEYNPYPGLLGAACHIIRRGISPSVDSEVFTMGKTVHVHASDTWEHPLKRQGYFRNIADYDDNEVLQTSVQNPLNITLELAERLLEKYFRTLRKNAPSYNLPDVA